MNNIIVFKFFTCKNIWYIKYQSYVDMDIMKMKWMFWAYRMLILQYSKYICRF